MIRLFGHSMVKVKNYNHLDDIVDDQHCLTFTDMIQEKYNCHTDNNVARGVGRCSEERILFYLKKQKDTSMAIIFHSRPFFTFLPGLESDLQSSRLKKDDIKYQYKHRQGALPGYNNVNHQLPRTTNNSSPKYLDELLPVLDNVRNLTYHRDLQLNRFNGALIQIDQYCTAKNIKVIHCVFRPDTIPNWFKFTSGIVDYSLTPYSFTESPYYVGYEKSINAIDATGNKLIFEQMCDCIDNYDKYKIA